MAIQSEPGPDSVQHASHVVSLIMLNWLTTYLLVATALSSPTAATEKSTEDLDSVLPNLTSIKWPNANAAIEDEPLNEPWTRLMPCNFGELPGTFLPHFTEAIRDIGTLHVAFTVTTAPLMPMEKVTQGSGWQVFDPRCQIKNFLHEYLNLRRPSLPSNKTDVRILSIGDSVDKHPIIWYAESLIHRFNNTPNWTKLQPFDYVAHDDQHRIFNKGGLSLLHQHLLGELSDDPTQHRGADVAKIAARSWAAVSKEAPDAVFINSAYWDLAEIERLKGLDPMALMLDPSFLKRWMNETSTTLRAVKKQFPDSLIIWRTTPPTRVDPVSGEPQPMANNVKDWSYQMHRAQINAAARAVCRHHHIPIVDLEMMSMGLTPAQADYDIHHPRSWLAMEYINVMLNYVIQYLRMKPFYTNPDETLT